MLKKKKYIIARRGIEFLRKNKGIYYNCVGCIFRVDIVRCSGDAYINNVCNKIDPVVARKHYVYQAQKTKSDNS